MMVLIVSSQSVDSQSTTDDETCSDVPGLLGELRRDVKRLIQQYQTIMDRLGKLERRVYR